MRISKLQRWRKFVNLKKIDAAAALGISPYRYSNLEDAQKKSDKAGNSIWLACAAIALGLKPISISLKDWRDLIHMPAEDAARLHDMSLMTYLKYEAASTGKKKKTEVPRFMLLACAAYSRGITYYRGPE